MQTSSGAFAAGVTNSWTKNYGDPPQEYKVLTLFCYVFILIYLLVFIDQIYYDYNVYFLCLNDIKLLAG